MSTNTPAANERFCAIAAARPQKILWVICNIIARRSVGGMPLLLQSRVGVRGNAGTVQADTTKKIQSEKN